MTAYALQPTIPRLTRSSLHRCLQRHGISRLPQVEGEASPKRKFKAYPIGYFHIDIAEVRTVQGKLYLIVAIDRTSKFAFVELHEKVARSTAADFLRRLIEAVPYRVHTVLTDNGTHFTDPAGECWSPAEIREMIANRQPFRAHAFDYACALNDIDHRLTKPRHPWTNGQVERMNRTLKDATVKRYFYEIHDQLRAHLRAFIDAYDFARRLKTLKGLTSYEFICKAWTSQSQRLAMPSEATERPLPTGLEASFAVSRPTHPPRPGIGLQASQGGRRGKARRRQVDPQYPCGIEH
jgi:transposase InsO family protein